MKRFHVGVGLLVVGLCLTAQAQVPDVPQVPGSARLLLDAIRDDLVGLRFEEALAAIEALLGQPFLSEADRGEALVLRSQAHVAFGDLDAAEQDYREILRTRPGFAPDTSLTPKKAMERFQRARAALIGQIVVDVRPPDAVVLLDGRPVAVTPEAKVPLVSGEHVIRAEREGFDPLQQTVRVEANKDARVELRLVPNARTVIVRTEPDDVDVSLNGAWVGKTARPADDDPWGTARKPAELKIENLTLGEYQIELSKACYRNESFRDLLTVDLLDWSPKVYERVALTPVRSTVVLVDGPEGAEVRIDGRAMSRLPGRPLEVCPGERRVEVLHGERRAWSHVVTLAEEEERVLQVEPRPNVVLLGRDGWPPELRPFVQHFNAEIDETATPPRDGESWERLGLRPDVDLALAPRERRRDDEPGWWLYSPALRLVTSIDASPELDRPQWTGVSWGLAVVDSERQGRGLVAHVVEGGAAATAGLRPGDRLVALGGSQVETAVQARRILAVASLGAPLDAEWLSPDGTSRRGRLEGRITLRLVAGSGDDADALVRAAWARVDAACDVEHASVATANLALLLSRHGRHEEAVRAWRRVELAERAGIGRGTVQYYLGRELQQIGLESEAIRAHRAAAAGKATAFDDEGPAVAPAARDCLADLGTR
jgi:tetratricopeptide (TPR) repeat protein